MNVGLYQGAASMQALERWQEAVSQNLASASVPGYKGTAVDFSTVMAGKQDKLNAEGPQGSGAMPLANLRRDMTQGELRSTGEPENLAIQGPGYFQVQGQDGKPAYTRDGEFHRSADGSLVTKTGLAVLGQSGLPSRSTPRRARLPSARTARSPRATARWAASDCSSSTTPCATPQRRAHSSRRWRQGFCRGATEGGFRLHRAEQRFHPALHGRTHHRAARLRGHQKVISTHDQRLSSAIQILGNPNAS